MKNTRKIKVFRKFIKGVPKKVSHSDFRVYVGQNKYYQYILNMSFIIGIRINGIFY